MQITSIFNPRYLPRIVQRICHSGDETFFGCSLTLTPGDYQNVSFDVNFIPTVFEDVFNMGSMKEAPESCFQSTSTQQCNCSHNVISAEKKSRGRKKKKSVIFVETVFKLLLNNNVVNLSM